MNNNIIAVIVGSVISLIAVYFAEHLRERRHIKETKILLLQNIKSLTRQIYRYAVLEAQVDVLSNYHNVHYKLSRERYHLREYNRRLRQYEDFKLKYLVLENEWDKIVILYYTLYGEDNEFKNLVNKFEEYDPPRAESLSDVNNVHELNAARDKEDERLTSEIDRTLKTCIEDLVEHVKKKLLK